MIVQLYGKEEFSRKIHPLELVENVKYLTNLQMDIVKDPFNEFDILTMSAKGLVHDATKMTRVIINVAFALIKINGIHYLKRVPHPTISTSKARTLPITELTKNQVIANSVNDVYNFKLAKSSYLTKYSMTLETSPETVLPVEDWIGFNNTRNPHFAESDFVFAPELDLVKLSDIKTVMYLMSDFLEQLNNDYIREHNVELLMDIFFKFKNNLIKPILPRIDFLCN
ncbi:hypothetical protein [Carp edema virus]|nr:hypothetical protein [Carp edema virus]